MEKNSSPIPTPAENSMAIQEVVLNSGGDASSPSRILPNRLHTRNRQVKAAALTATM